MQFSDTKRLVEITAVIFTGLGKFIFMDLLNWRLPYIATATLFWVVYIFYQKRQHPDILQYWGLTTDHFGRTFVELLPLAVVSAGTFVLLGNHLGTNILSADVLPLLILYPFWGIIQQFIMIGVLAKNLSTLERVNLPTWGVVLVTALTFAVVHFPFFLLVIGTFLLALVYTTLYLKGRNLVVMGIYHGWLGAFFFFTVLERNPWQEVFGRFIS